MIVFVTLLLGFTAAMVGSLRERYGSPGSSVPALGTVVSIG